MKILDRCCMLALFALATVSCDLIEYHPYDVKIDSRYKHINAKNIARIEANQTGSDTIRIALMGDTQRCYDETVDFVKDINKRHQVDFVIHGGDISDFGMAKEYMWMHDILSKLYVPYVAVIGNHDIVGHGKEVYRAIYGDYNFSFTFKGTKFVCLNTNALEYDYSTPIPDYQFIEQQIKDTATNYTQTIAVMHVKPFDDEFNNNTVYYFQDQIKKLRNPLCALAAHSHVLLDKELYGDGFHYIGCDDIKDRNYLLFTITKNHYSYQVINF